MEPDAALLSGMLFAESGNRGWLQGLDRRVRAPGQVWRLDYASGHENYTGKVSRIFSVPHKSISELRGCSALQSCH